MKIFHCLEEFKAKYCPLERGYRYPEISGKIYFLFSSREGTYLSSAPERTASALADT